MVTKLGKIQIVLAVLTFVFFFMYLNSYTNSLASNILFPLFLISSGAFVIIKLARDYNLICPNCLSILSLSHSHPTHVDSYEETETEERTGYFHRKPITKTYEKDYNVDVYEITHRCKKCNYTYTTRFKRYKKLRTRLVDIDDRDEDYFY